MNTDRLIDLLLAQRRDGFAALSGTRVDATVALDERLLNEIISTAIPSDAPVADVVAHPLAGQQVRVGLRVPRVSFLPRLNLTLAIAAQPSLPDRPELVLRLVRAGGLLALAGPALRFFGAMPPGISIAGELVRLDLPRLLSDRGLGDVLPLLERLEIETTDAHVRVHLGVRVP